MLDSWKDFLVSEGAVCDSSKALRFGDAITELVGARTQTVLADLSHFTVIEASGEDARDFLHGQFTNDVTRLDGSNGQRNGYCSPKGRLLASFLLWQREGKYYLLMPASVAPAVLKRLTMFVLRAKVRLTDVSEQVMRLGVAGSKAREVLRSVLGAAPDAPLRIAEGDGGGILALEQNRYLLLTTPERAKRLWQALDKPCHKVGSAVWDWLTIRAGIPVITPPTQEQFVPQMVNFEAIGGLDFKKGCYPGQEIVARMQYLGKLKRRMYLVHMEANGVAAGDELFSSDLAEQAAGMIVNAAPSPDGGTDALAVIQMESALNHPIHWKTPDGPLLKVQALPYSMS